MKSWILCAALATTFASPTAFAQMRLPNGTPIGQDGAYYDPTRSGTGLWIDYGPDGDAFAAVMTYDAEGRPTFETFGGALYRPLFTYPRAFGGTRYRTENGQCLGCDWRAPVTSALPGSYQVIPALREISVTPSFRALSTLPLDEDPDDLLGGRWLLALSANGTSSQPGDSLVSTGDVFAVVDFDRTEASFGSAVASDTRYVARCVSSCEDYERWRNVLGGGELVAYRDAPTWLETPYRLTVAPREADGSYVVRADAKSYVLDVGRWTAYATSARDGTTFAWGDPRRLRLYRDPITGPCDEVELCIGDDGVGKSTRAFEKTLGGAYFDRSKPGTGLWLDVGRNGTTFMTLMTYDAGPTPTAYTRPSFYTFGGPIGNFPIVFVSRPGVLAPLYRSEGGSPFGSASYVAPRTTAQPELGNAFVLFNSAKRVSMRVAGRDFELEGMSFRRSNDDTAIGDWYLAVDDELVGGGAAATARHERFGARIRIDRIATPRTIVRGTDVRPQSLSLQPLPGANQYAVTCVERCGGFDAWRAGRDVVMWSNGGGALVLSTVRPIDEATAIVEPGARQYVVQIGDDRLVGDALVVVAAQDESGVANQGGVELLRDVPLAEGSR